MLKSQTPAQDEFLLSKKLTLKIRRSARRNGTTSFVFEWAQGGAGQRLEVPEHLMDAFRRSLVNVSSMPPEVLLNQPHYVTFSGKNVFRIACFAPADGAPIVVISDLVSSHGDGGLSLPLAELPKFAALVFEDRLGHPSGCLERVMSYHSLLQLAFPTTSASLNATMGHRKGFLCFEIANPKLQDPVFSGTLLDETPGAQQNPSTAKGVIAKGTHPKDFKSRLGIKTKSSQDVNYDALLAALGVKSAGAQDHQDSESAAARRKRDDTPVLDLGLTAHELSKSQGNLIRITPDEFDLQALREVISQNSGSNDFFLGFEIVDLWYLDRSKKVRAFRFPLYFMKVALVDLGGNVEIKLQDSGRFTLNFLALADAIEKFSGARASETHLEEFFNRIQLIRFEFAGELERLRVERKMPAAQELFAAQRRALLGQEESGPLGGALEGLTIKHVAIDTERTFFYPRNLALSEAEQALAADLVRIRKSSLASTQTFNQSLLGKVFNPLQTGSSAVAPAALPPCNPFPLPDSNAHLFQEFDRKDLLLVEGPPGTGKTFSMLNLLVHCVCNGKRVLVVSDKASALDALYEKLAEFLRTDVSDEREFRQRELAIRAGIKRPTWNEKSLDKIQDAARALKAELRLDAVQELLMGQAPQNHEAAFLAGLQTLDAEIRARGMAIDDVLNAQFGPSVPGDQRICSRNWHETTADEVKDLADFVATLLSLRTHNAGTGGAAGHSGTSATEILKAFVRNRQRILWPHYPGLAKEFCPVDHKGWKNQLERLQRAHQVLESILKHKPQTVGELEPLLKPVAGTRWGPFLVQLHIRVFGHPKDQNPSGLRRIKDHLFFPLSEDLQNLISVLRDDMRLFEIEGLMQRRCVQQLIKVHRFLTTEAYPMSQCLAWAVLKEWLDGDFGKPQAHSSRRTAEIGQLLQEISLLQKQRSLMVKKRFTKALSDAFVRQAKHHAAHGSHGAQNASPSANSKSPADPNTAPDAHQMARDLMSQIDTEFERVVRSENVTMGIHSFNTLKSTVVRCFPVWLALKEHISLAMPSEAGIFDLVIIDESTQCRVDDAIPLIYRAKKVIAVGDENQTVLQRSSVLDDFLFENLELESHLHVLGATSIKAAGSHFFGLLKGLKQSRILLDEHYRCPPEVIEFSNKYVYDNMLKIMKWRPLGSTHPVVIDHSERRTRNRNRPTSGKYKGIEIGMIDRFFEWVESSILAFEKETGRRINLETDVAICYFLLKNEEYVKERKAQFLRAMKRGEEVLDGAGAALQGKERDLIFFLWDITRANLQAFMQGDDPAKRKGELNVLMSRPRLRAYHFLHKDFATLDHGRSSITHYLWSTLKRQEMADHQQRQAGQMRPHGRVHPSESRQTRGSADPDEALWGSSLPEWSVRSQRPTPATLPWRRGDGQLLYEVIRHVCHTQGLGAAFDRYIPQYSVIIGKPEYRVDLILNPKRGHESLPRLALVELSAFESTARSGDVLNFASLLGRASPTVEPIFLHLHELLRPESFAVRRLVQLLIDANKATA